MAILYDRIMQRATLDGNGLFLGDAYGAMLGKGPFCGMIGYRIFNAFESRCG